MKKIFFLFLVLALSSLYANARKYIINAGRTTPLPVRIVVDNKSYYITERNQYSNNPETGACLVFERNGNFTFDAYAPDNTPLDAAQYTKNNKTDSYGNIEYTRIVLGGTGVTRSTSSKNREVSEEASVNDYNSSYGSNYANSGKSASDYKENIASNVRGSVESIGSKFNNVATTYMAYDTDGYPNIMFKFGISRLWGEYARFKACIGGLGGFVLYGGIGKKFIGSKGLSTYVPGYINSWGYEIPGYTITSEEFKDRITWHAGIGYYISPDEDGNSDVSLGVSFGKSCCYEKFVMSGNLTYSWFFGDRKIFGVHGGAGIGVAFADGSDELKFAWDLEVGIAVKLWQSK